jgi:hypothetical protein
MTRKDWIAHTSGCTEDTQCHFYVAPGDYMRAYHQAYKHSKETGHHIVISRTGGTSTVYFWGESPYTGRTPRDS